MTVGESGGCDGVNTPCTYTRVSEINGDLRRMVYTQFGDSTLFSVHSDDAPTVYVNGTSAQPIRDQTDPAVRSLEREMAGLSWLNPYTNAVENNIMVALADHTEMKTLHMITAGPLVGPGVENNGVDQTTWSDHTDVRPTILDLVGLKDDYTHDGRLLSEDLSGFAIPPTVKRTGSYAKLATIYKQLNASFGAFDMDTLKVSTKALASGSSSDDSTYTSLENQIGSLTAQRDTLASQIKTTLDDVAFNGKSLTEAQAKPLIAQAQSLLDQAHALAS